MALSITFHRPQDAALFALLTNMMQAGKVWCDWRDLHLPKRHVIAAKKAGFVEVWEFVDRKVKYRCRLTPEGHEMAKLMQSLTAAAEAAGKVLSDSQGCNQS